MEEIESSEQLTKRMLERAKPKPPAEPCSCEVCQLKEAAAHADYQQRALEFADWKLNVERCADRVERGLQYVA